MKIETTLPDFEIVLDEADVKTIESTPQEGDVNEENNPEDTPKENEHQPEAPVYSDKADPNAIAFYEELKTRNYVNDDFDGTWESLDSIIDDLPNRALHSLVEQSPEITKQVIRFAFSSEDITKEDLVNFVKTYTDELEESSTEIETMDDARNYLEKVYEEQKLGKATISKILDSLEEDDLLLEEAKKIKSDKDEVNKFSKSEKLIAQKEQETIQRKQEQVQFSKTVVEELQNTGWKQNKINTVTKVLSGGELSSKLNEIIKSPKAIVKLADFITYYNNGDIDYTNFIKQVETPQAKGLKERLESTFNSTGSTTRSLPKNTNIQNTENEIPIV